MCRILAILRFWGGLLMASLRSYYPSCVIKVPSSIYIGFSSQSTSTHTVLFLIGLGNNSIRQVKVRSRIMIPILEPGKPNLRKK